LVVVGVLVLVLRTVRVSGTAGPARVARAVAGDVREGLLGRGVWPGVLLSSMLVMAGYTAGYYVAVRNAGYHGSAVSMLPLAMLVLAAMSVPASIAGWGPREGVAAWVFAVAGLGAELGVATTVVYGAMVFVASLPGGVLLLLDLLRRGHSEAATLRERRELEPVSVEADRPRTW
ncbi:MAG: UPF0104 family protein, partial [Nocardioidaceae bacterium]|nr:UPF0104 family protein [Nocardioidaceae bacterium]